MTAAAALLLAACARAGWRVEALSGGALNAPAPLAIRQAGFPALELTARYATREFTFHAPYYAWRAGRWADGRGWEFEHIHHKLVLRNRPPEVGAFSVSHGYNLLFAVRGWETGPLALRAGVGPVVGHPESVVRGRAFADEGGLFGAGYYVAGAAALASAGWRWPARGPWHAALEAALTAAWARVPVRGGTADVPDAALHGLAGVGADF